MLAGPLEQRHVLWKKKRMGCLQMTKQWPPRSSRPFGDKREYRGSVLLDFVKKLVGHVKVRICPTEVGSPVVGHGIGAEGSAVRPVAVEERELAIVV